MMTNPNTHKTPHQDAKEQAEAKNADVLRVLSSNKKALTPTEIAWAVENSPGGESWSILRIPGHKPMANARANLTDTARTDQATKDAPTDASHKPAVAGQVERSVRFHRRWGSVAYLEYDYEGKRQGNIGGDVIFKLASELCHVERISADMVDAHELVLVSIPSSGQLIDVFRLAMKHGWDKRRCKILVGGYGVQNVNLLRGLIDFAFFGRAHDCLREIIDGIMQGGVPDSLREHMISVDSPHVVRFRQAPLMDNSVFREEFTGCPLKCKFCHYTYARKFNGKTSGYTQALLTDGNSDEVLYSDIPGFSEKRGRIRTAIDGFSERIRYLYGKRISNDLIVQGINHLGEIATDKYQTDMFGGNEMNRRTVMTVYNICNFPYETQDDELEFIDNVQRSTPKTRVIFILHSTPFRASPATPMQWERVQVFPDWSKQREKTICDRPDLLVKYSYTLEGPWSQLQAAICERARDDDAVARAAMAFRSSKRAADKTRDFMERYDTSHHLGEHPIDGPAPGAWYLRSYLTDSQIAKIAHKMRAQRGEWK